MNRSEVARSLHDLREAIASSWRNQEIQSILHERWKSWEKAPESKIDGVRSRFHSEVHVVLSSLEQDFALQPPFRDTLKLLSRMPPSSIGAIAPATVDDLCRLIEQTMASDEAVRDADDRRAVKAAIVRQFPAMQKHPEVETYLDEIILPLRGFFVCQVVSYMIAKVSEQDPSSRGQKAATRNNSRSVEFREETGVTGALRHARHHARDDDEAAQLFRIVEQLPSGPYSSDAAGGLSTAKLADLLRTAQKVRNQRVDGTTRLADYCIAKLTFLVDDDGASMRNVKAATDRYRHALEPLAEQGLAWALFDLGLLTWAAALGADATMMTSNAAHRANRTLAEDLLRRAANIGMTAARLQLAKSIGVFLMASFEVPPSAATPAGKLSQAAEAKRMKDREALARKCIDDVLDSDDDWDASGTPQRQQAKVEARDVLTALERITTQRMSRQSKRSTNRPTTTAFYTRRAAVVAVVLLSCVVAGVAWVLRPGE